MTIETLFEIERCLKLQVDLGNMKIFNLIWCKRKRETKRTRSHLTLKRFLKVWNIERTVQFFCETQKEKLYSFFFVWLLHCHFRFNCFIAFPWRWKKKFLSAFASRARPGSRVARFFLVQKNKVAMYIPNSDELQHTFPSQGLPKGSIWYANIPSGNPAWDLDIMIKILRKFSFIPIWATYVDCDDVFVATVHVWVCHIRVDCTHM
jgi:hypothetical protein